MAMQAAARPVHPHMRGVYEGFKLDDTPHYGSSPRAWGLPLSNAEICCDCRSIPTYVGFTHPFRQRLLSTNGPSPHTWGLLRRNHSRPYRHTVHPHIRGVYTEIKSKISRASSKTALLPAEKFKILFLVKIKGSAAAFQVHTIFRDQFPPGLHFEIALHL